MMKVTTRKDASQINCAKLEYLVLIISIYNTLLGCRCYELLIQMNSIHFNTKLIRATSNNI